ncbi:AAA family ATPase [uncultured Brachyspira sp.]|uniref:ATP-dependent DNA helicase n=1 Tax=uncultured Brachyspira sp. TaxID=221953 RepID=UPI0026132091|nr:AAA family ATPase [uncultured Brachyspira sp.]
MSNIIRHLSLRVPWMDKPWNGEVCYNPKENRYCTILKNIMENKTEESCKQFDNDNCPCIKEKASFMYKEPLGKIVSSYPYKYRDNCKHFEDTELEYKKPYSVPSICFRWLFRNNENNPKIDNIMRINNIKLNLNDGIEDALSLTKNKVWYQLKENQEKIFNTFYGYVKPEKSLCFFYTKNAPFVEEVSGRRIITAIGNILSVSKNKEYEYNKPIDQIENEGLHRALLWEHIVEHSIRKDDKGYYDGVLFPYHELNDYLNKNQDKANKIYKNIDDYVLFSSVESFENFSYSTEHVIHNDAIELLIKAKKVVNNLSKLLNKNFIRNYKWIENKIIEVLKLRGPYPLFGEVLSALGFNDAFEIEKKIYEEYSKNNIIDFWDYFENNLETLTDVKKNNTVIDIWKNKEEEEKDFYYFLSRLNIQISVDDIKNNIISNIEKYIENPYKLYTGKENVCTIHNIYKRPIKDILCLDNALYISDEVKELFPNIKGMHFDDEYNYKRVTAFIYHILNNETENTILSISDIFKKIKDLSSLNELNLNVDIINAISNEEYFKELIYKFGQNDHIILQLQYYKKTKDIIEDTIKERLKKIDNINNSVYSEIENKYRDKDSKYREQIEAIKALYHNKFSVLRGSAGSGKTYVISEFCSLNEVNDSGIIILTPTGKARTVISKKINNNDSINKAKIDINTIAGFTSRNKRYDDYGDFILYEYCNKGTLESKTLIIDECSMLTEDSLAAVFEIARTSVDRIILVGDDSQLPPIGRGKPFYDIINYLKDNNNDHLVTLTNNHRQEEGSISIEFAMNFRNDIYEKNDSNNNINNIKKDDIKFIKWTSNNDRNSSDDLIKSIKEAMAEIGITDKNSYLENIGGGKSYNGVYLFDFYTNSFNVEKWQILTPLRQNTLAGSITINSHIHNILFPDEIYKDYYKIENCKTFSYLKKISAYPSPCGAEKIVYGSKVINLLNQKRYGNKNIEEFIANGEIGAVVGRYDNRMVNKAYGTAKESDHLYVNFPNVGDTRFKYTKQDFEGNNSDSNLELAYAITCHKSQGSQFKNTIVVIPKCSSFFMSKEMLYTIFTRHEENIYVLVEVDDKNITDDELKKELLKFNDYIYSKTTFILTNLFNNNPKLIYRKDCGWYDENKVHITERGEKVRSKSEVIIANYLYQKEKASKIEYSYEVKYEGKIGDCKLPDFTIIKGDKTYLLEHLGMLSNENYKNKWEEKKKWYENNGIYEASNDNKDKVQLIVTKDENGALEKDIYNKLDKYLD